MANNKRHTSMKREQKSSSYDIKASSGGEDNVVKQGDSNTIKHNLLFL
jgi:hypothetical protein